MNPARHLKAMVFLFFLCIANAWADDSALESYIAGFDHRVQQEMKIDNSALVEGIRQDRILVVDIRFRPEIEAQPLGFGTAMPMNELAVRWKELPKDKLLVTVCPVKDRAIIAMVFLKTKGFKVKYLNDGLLGLAKYLRVNRIKL